MPVVGYFVGSVLMYAFGMYIAIAGNGDIFTFIAGSRFRLLACGVVLFSTLTTAFLDLYSAALSFTQLVKTKNKKLPILVIGLAAAIIAAVFPAEQYGAFLETFLVSIGMVFVPVYTLVFIDFFIKKPRETQTLPLIKILIAVAGMAAYRFFTIHETGIPTVISVLLVCVLYMAFTIANSRGLDTRRKK
jgi:purine-cytosine permease-like protein